MINRILIHIRQPNGNTYTGGYLSDGMVSHPEIDDEYIEADPAATSAD